MAELIVFPDAALAAVLILRAGVDDTAVGTRVPNPREHPFVVVRRIGGVRRNMVVDAAQLSVECWAATEEAAHDLAQLCRGLLHQAEGTTVDGITVYRMVEIGGPVLLPDPESADPRYVGTYELNTRGTAA